MIPGYSLIINCPHCGCEKRLMSLLSGNTFGAQCWSDTKQDAPMLPQVSYVQKCPHCGSYFLLPKEKPRYDKKDCCYDLGTLSYEEMKEAFLQLQNNVTGTDMEIPLRLSFIHSFNDAFRYETKETREDNDWELHRSNILGIIPLLENQGGDSIPVVAEFYREIGDFDKCLSVLAGYTPSSEFQKSVCDEIERKAKKSVSMVFEIK